jgi:2,3-diaminopropionate biosynthesis protein SbnB
MANKRKPEFSVIPGAQVDRIISGREKEIIGVIERAYLEHRNGETVNPPSYFLRFADRPDSRIIALPASIPGADGIKWISSFPGNVDNGLPRASAVIVLNDHETGYPLACVEGSIISAARTAASAALAAGGLGGGLGRAARIGFIGAGLIARYVHTFLVADGWAFEEIGVHDLNPNYGASFVDSLRQAGADMPITVYPEPETLIRNSDVIVFATVASRPHITEPSWFAHGPLVLHLSLRDLAPEIILSAANVVDDVDHCLRENTSPHLAERAAGHREFIHATIGDVLAGYALPQTGAPVVFSPFGLGVLDLAVAAHVYGELRMTGELRPVDGFFHALGRHG